MAFSLAKRAALGPTMSGSTPRNPATITPANSVAKPIPPMPSGNGTVPKPALSKPPLGQLPIAQNQPQIAGARKPSVVAQIGRAKGGEHAIQANIQDMFNQPSKQASILDQLFLKQMHSKPSPLIHKLAIAVATGDPLPKGFNGRMHPPTQSNGGKGSYGEEAWKSFEVYRPSKAKKLDFKRDWHVKD